MDRIKSTADLIVKLNQYDDGELHDYELISAVCAYFDEIKNERLSDADKQFLYYIANKIGIPQYYDTLCRFSQDTKIENISLQVFADAVKESLLFTAKDTRVHRYQKEILEHFRIGQNNRYFLSASTSFGKTFMVYEIMRKMQYRNILLLFPSIALLSENLEKIYSDRAYEWVKDSYKVHTITSFQDIGERNIFLYTPERYLSFLDISVHRNTDFDFVFVDEVYKIDNEYIVDEEIKESERDISYRLAIHHALANRQTDCLLAGPYIKFGERGEEDYNPSFDRFMERQTITLLDYNKYDIVNKERDRIIVRDNKTKTYCHFLHDKMGVDENVIVYCSRKADVEKYARVVVNESTFPEINIDPINDFYQHVISIFDGGEEWIVARALRKGIGIHHGLVPKYIQKEIINLFNKGYIKVLISTTTITEGVNTTAKNVLIMSHKKGKKDLKSFDAKNIEGRAGRFMRHYKGNVFYLDKEYEAVLMAKEEPIKHKYFDEQAPKQDVDLYYADTQYLNQRDVARKQEIERLREEIDVPDEILNQFKVISRNDKLKMYKAITELRENELNQIVNLIRNYQVSLNITIRDFDVIVRLVMPFVQHQKLLSMMENDVKRPFYTCSILAIAIFTYFKYGLAGRVSYLHRMRQDISIDAIVRDETDFVYNVLRYQVVKYFGAFNVLYKYYIAKVTGKSYNSVIGIDAILIRMEYNAKTQYGRVASDYGVPQRVLEYYDAEDEEKKTIRQKFDAYEKVLFERIDSIITA